MNSQGYQLTTKVQDTACSSVKVHSPTRSSQAVCCTCKYEADCNGLQVESSGSWALTLQWCRTSVPVGLLAAQSWPQCYWAIHPAGHKQHGQCIFWESWLDQFWKLKLKTVITWTNSLADPVTPINLHCCHVIREKWTALSSGLASTALLGSHVISIQKLSRISYYQCSMEKNIFGLCYTFLKILQIQTWTFQIFFQHLQPRQLA